MTGSVHERNGYWYIVLSYKKDGKWKTKWIGTGLTVKGNKINAKKMIPDTVEKYSYLESAIISSDMTVSAFMQEWLKRKKNAVRASTFEGYSYRAKKIEEYPPFMTLPIGRLDSLSADKFFQEMLESGKINQKTHQKEPLAVRTVREYKNCLSDACDDAVNYGLLKGNPIRSMRVSGKKNRDYKKDIPVLSKDEVVELIRFMQTDDEIFRKLAPMTFMCTYYGLRRSELLGLTWSAVNFKKRTITINKTVTRVSSIHEENSTKTASSYRELVLFKKAEEMLQGIQKQRDENKKFYGNTYHDSDFIFVWEDGRTYDPNYVSRTFAKATKKFGRPEVSLHKLRHSCATILIEEGWDPKKLQHWLGHSDVQTTLSIYTHYDTKRDRAEADTLEDLASGISF